MELNVLNETKNRSLNEELNTNILAGEKISTLQSDLEKYLANNKEPNCKNETKSKIPVDIEINTEKNEMGDTTILGKITIEKSAIDDMSNIKNKSTSAVRKGLKKIYNAVQGTFVEKIADKTLELGGKMLKYGAKAIKVLGKKILKI